MRERPYRTHLKGEVIPMIREEGWINPNTFLIDAVHEGMSRIHAMYLLKSSDGGTCLIDAGTKSSASVIYETLKTLDAWPPDKIILTHSHWDHTQGLVYLRKKAAETGDALNVFASEKAMPYLKDQSFNICFGTDQMPYLDIDDVGSVKGGDVITLGDDFSVTIVDTPGHMVDHISIYDEKNSTILVGDAIGMKWSPELLISNPNSTFWSEKDYRESIATIKRLNVETIGLTHFGCLVGEEANTFLDESVSTYEKWMDVFGRNKDRLDDLPFIVGNLWEEVYPDVPKKLRVLVDPGLTEATGMAVNAYKSRNT
jgi:glyoxylase-like metal-dependent hydrolase (beta-lactamase superfamily II)